VAIGASNTFGPGQRPEFSCQRSSASLDRTSDQANQPHVSQLLEALATRNRAKALTEASMPSKPLPIPPGAIRIQRHARTGHVNSLERMPSWLSHSVHSLENQAASRAATEGNLSEFLRSKWAPGKREGAFEHGLPHPPRNPSMKKPTIPTFFADPSHIPGLTPSPSLQTL
jgi:hypothetical protein